MICAQEYPTKHVTRLEQCLFSDKRPIGLFLGAGCPASICADNGKPLIPDVAGMTDFVRQELKICEEYGEIFCTIEEHFKTDERDNPTVEDMLTHIRALHAVAGKDKVRRLSAEQLDKLDKKICDLIHKSVDKELPYAETPYHHVALWADAIPREKPVEIFTTNYDLLMEYAFEDTHVPYFDGFVGVRKPFFNLRVVEEDEKLPSRWVRLRKLHGSINWYQNEEQKVFRATTNENDQRRFIHPSHLKYQESRRMPYLAMIDKLREFLRCPTATLILCGYSFRDDHINEIIIQGLQRTQTAVAFALLFDPICKYEKATKLAGTQFNLNVLARDSGIVGGQQFGFSEKNAESVSVDENTWIDWKCLSDSKRKRGELILGDFKIFGRFLKKIVGNIQR